ncbi:hypothetical protein EDD85DRAFT_892856 [Armillaria nabsnona]|nr:hypothetical protein EDD85DRAFT_892856 [Armillaria nabsnona]
MGTPSLSALLEDCIEKKYDFGTAYSHLRRVWNTDDHSNIRDVLHRLEEEDQEMRRKAVVGNKIVNPNLLPRRVWDLYSNRVVPWWIANESDEWPRPISHAWVDEKDRVDVWTPINGKEWPVPIPKDASLDLIRIEMLNLGVDYVWLDVLCLRQKGGPRDHLRAEEWKLDVPTIGGVYAWAAWVVIYLSGLGRPSSLKEGDLESDRGWFRRAWTLQEVGTQRIIAGDTPDAPMHAQPIDNDGNYETEILTRHHKQLESLQGFRDIFCVLADMQSRVSTNPVDKVAGLAFLLFPITIPAYHESESLEAAWTALVNAMGPVMRACFLFLYPGVGLGCKKWRPTWEQVMTEPLPADDRCPGFVKRDDETDEDWYEGACIEKGHVQGLAEGGDRSRCGELVIEGVDGMAHTFKILVTHQLPILEDTYTLIGSNRHYLDGTLLHSQYWAFGRRLPEQRFEKYSVFRITGRDEIDRLDNLGVARISQNILV